MTRVEALEREIAKLGITIAAAEDWSPQYAKDPKSHGKIIALQNKLEFILRRYFREFATERINKYINWATYSGQVVRAYDVNVVVQDGALNDEVNILLNVVHDPLLSGMATGALAGETIYGQQLGITSSEAALQEAARKYSAELVTKVNDVTKDRIRQSIATSLQLGEDQTAATSRLQSVIRDPKRAGVIARTEAVNSYSQGLLNFGDASGAVGKEWQALNAIDECNDLDGEQVGIGENFSSGDDAPPLHPNCRCGLRLIYKNEDGADQFVDVPMDDSSD